jgi:hypothetical protein
MKPDIFNSGFMTAWWIRSAPVWLLLRVWSLKSMATGSRLTAAIPGNRRIYWLKGC